MKTVLVTLFLSIALSGAAKAEVSWNDFPAPQDLKHEVDQLLTNKCPIMMGQELFQVINVTKTIVSTALGLYNVELQGRGYGSGDPDHHFIILVSEESKIFKVEQFIVLAECH